MRRILTSITSRFTSSESISNLTIEPEPSTPSRQNELAETQVLIDGRLGAREPGKYLMTLLVPRNDSAAISWAAFGKYRSETLASPSDKYYYFAGLSHSLPEGAALVQIVNPYPDSQNWEPFWARYEEFKEVEAKKTPSEG